MNTAYVKALPSYGLVPLLGVLLLLGYLTQLICHAMPKVVTEEEAGFTQFSEERAWRHLTAIVGDGPRVAGSRYHLQKTEELKAMLDEISTAAVQTVHVDWQLVTGDYYLSYRLPYINSYQQASNVIALLEGDSGFNDDDTSNSSLLFNCHYDSVPTAPGASDNAIFCAAMVETLSVLSRSQHKMKHNIVFLFNGAEENSLQASHGFLSHRWSRGVTGLINLDSSGMNGKSVLFQATDPRVLSAYSGNVGMPSAQAIGEALFTSGAVPSDTDFRVFRDFGPIYGVDIAFTRYGHVYHTRYDAVSAVLPGVVQHAGNMLYKLARAMGDMDEFAEKQHEASGAVYWDYLNLFMLDYTYTTANVVDALVGIFALSSVFYYLWTVGMRRRHMKELFWSVVAVAISLLAGILLVYVMTVLMVNTMAQLRYYSNPWLVVPMYWMPFLLAAIAATHTCDWWRSNKSGLNRAIRAAQAMAACRLLWGLALLSLLLVPAAVTMRYAVSVPLLLTTLFAYVSLTVRRFWRVNAWQHLLMELVFSLPALLFIFTLCLSMDALMLPIMGRSATRSPDSAVMVINVVLVVLACMPLAGIELLFSRRRLWLVGSLLGVVSLVLMFLPLAVYSSAAPYPAPQRYNIFHTERITLNQSGSVVARSSGLWAGHTDANSPGTLLAATQDVPRNTQTDFVEDCEQHLYCNLPTVTPRSADIVPYSVWMEFPPPAAFDPPPAVLLTDRDCQLNACVLNFTVTGTPHVSIAMWPRAGVTLQRWSFSAEVANITSKHGRPVYYVYHTFCTYQQPQPTFDFTLWIEVPDGTGQSDPLLDVAFNAHKTHHADEMTAEFSDLVRGLPEWFNVVPYITTTINYVF